MRLPALITAMLRPEFYPHRPDTVTLEQTHISYVFLAGAEVYKVKKPVRFSFLDFSTLERRRHFCHEEVRLNRRLAGDVYLGVVAIRRRGEAYELAPLDDAGVIEYAVHMRRLPAERMLDRLLDRGAATPTLIEAIARRLVEFHRAADAGPAVAASGDPAAIGRVLEDNYAGARPFRDRTLPAADDDAIQTFARDFLRRHDALLRRRQTAGRIRDGHGDLHSEHVCCTEPLVIYDCIEFNQAFRYCDVAADIAFLAMDLEYHGHPELAARLTARYAAESGDTEITRLLPFYQCYRAYVRGKVDSLKAVEEEVAPAECAAARASATRHFALAYRYTWAERPLLVAVAGLSGTGKSAIAATVHTRTGFVHVNSDVVRKQLGGLAPAASGREAYGAGLYSAPHSARTYAALLAETGRQLAEGHGVIVDATFQRRADRDAARAVARAYGVPVLFVECRCGEDAVRRRLDERAAHGGSASDADWRIYLQQRRYYEAFGADEDADHLVLDTAALPPDLSAEIERALRARLP